MVSGGSSNHRLLGRSLCQRCNDLPPDGWVINVSVEAADMHDAWMSAMRSIFSAGLESKLPFWRPLIAVTVLDGEYAVAIGRRFESS
jgi:hypothetical protein